MPYVFLDYENIKGEYMTILGLYNVNQLRTQLYEEYLQPKQVHKFLNDCRNEYPFYLFCHGPDIGRIEKHFSIELKKPHYCINLVTAFRRFTECSDCGLKELEKYFGISRQYDLTFDQIDTYWNSGLNEYRRIVLDYNWEDCVNLRKLFLILKNNYGVTNQDFESIAMQ